MEEHNKLYIEPEFSEISERPPRTPTSGGECKEILYCYIYYYFQRQVIQDTIDTVPTCAYTTSKARC